MTSAVPTVTEAAKALLEAIEHAYTHRGCGRLAGEDTRHINRSEIERQAAVLSDALLMADKRAKIGIALNNGTTKRVPGYIVAEHFGITGRRVGSQTYWDVTHIPSGLSAMWHGGSFDKRAQAVAYAEAIAPLLDWSTLTAENSRERFTDDIRDAIRTANDAARGRWAA